jgi:hypothetical protein
MEKETRNEAAQQEGPLSFDSALKEVIKRLKGQPLLLFMLGGGLLFATTAQPILLPFFMLGMVIWGFLEVKKLQEGSVKSGKIQLGSGVKASNSEASTGGVSGGKGSTRVESGDIHIGSKSELKGVKLKTGNIKMENSSGDSSSKKKAKQDG